jgi:acetate kinase
LVDFEVAATLGFSPAEGLMIGTRCGAVDSGVLLYLMESHSMDIRALENP